MNVATFAERTEQFWSMEYDFVAWALGSSVAVGLLCGLVGCFLVLRGMSLLGDATGHATLPGVCIGFLIAGSQKTMGWLLSGALVTGLLAAWLVGFISRRPRTRPDAAIGAVLSVFFGAGIVLLSYIQSSPTGAQSGLGDFLFGNAAAVSPTHTVTIWILALVLIVAVLIFRRVISVVIFDRVFAESTAVRAAWVDYGLLGALGLAVVASIQAVGVVLVSAMLIIPGASAVLLSARLERCLVISALLGAVSGLLGTWLSFVFEGVGTGPAMTLVASMFFGLALFFSPRMGLLSLALRRRRLRGETQWA